MAARFEVTKKYAQAYAAAPRKGKSVILDHVVEVTGWNRDHARQQLVARLKQAPGRAVATVAVIDRRKTKPRKYSYDAIKILQQVWATAGGSCGKYLTVAMTDWLDAMETEGSLVSGQDRYSAEVRAELESMSAATIDRYLAPTRATDPLRGKSATRPGSLLRNSIQIRKAGDEVEAARVPEPFAARPRQATPICHYMSAATPRQPTEEKQRRAPVVPGLAVTRRSQASAASASYDFLALSIGPSPAGGSASSMMSCSSTQ